MSDLNGRLPPSALARVPGGHLRKDAAAAFNAMNAESERRYGVTLCSEGPLGTYRTLAEQKQVYAVYEKGGNLAAFPGTSNHGLGLAIDIKTHHMRTIVDEIGRPYGWSKTSDAKDEWWHLVYQPGVWHPPRDRHHDGTEDRHRHEEEHVSHDHVTSTDVTAIVQQLLRARGHHDLHVNGILDSATVTTLKAFQRKEGLPETGEPDRDTVLALRGHAPHAHPHTDSDDHPHPHPGKHTHTHTHVRRRHTVSSDQDPFAPARFPLNRVLTLLGPAIALLAGACAAWLSQHFPGLVTDESGTKAELTQAGTFVVGAVITWAIHHKYLDGWQRWETGVVQLEVQRRRHEQQLELQHRKHEHELELERARSHTHEHAHEDEDGHRHLHVKRHVSDDSAFGDPFSFEPFSDQARFAHDG